MGHCVLQYAKKPQLSHTVEIKTDSDTVVHVKNLNAAGCNYKKSVSNARN